MRGGGLHDEAPTPGSAPGAQGPAWWETAALTIAPQFGRVPFPETLRCLPSAASAATGMDTVWEGGAKKVLESGRGQNSMDKRSPGFGVCRPGHSLRGPLSLGGDEGEGLL